MRRATAGDRGRLIRPFLASVMPKTRSNAAVLASLEAAVGYAFADRALLERALIHASVSGEPMSNNERLEFLGDRVLGLLTAEALLAAHAGESEGGLAPRLNALVRRETCAEIADSLGLGAALKLSRAEAASGGRRKTALLADAMEAVIAAVYLDGGMAAARVVFERHWRARLARQDAAPIDAKTALQEWAQGRGMPTPSYRLVERSGPDHAPRFTVAVELEGGDSAVGEGSAKRSAEQAAAEDLLARVAARDD